MISVEQPMRKASPCDLQPRGCFGGEAPEAAPGVNGQLDALTNRRSRALLGDRVVNPYGLRRWILHGRGVVSRKIQMTLKRYSRRALYREKLFNRPGQRLERLGSIDGGAQMGSVV